MFYRSDLKWIKKEEILHGLSQKEVEKGQRINMKRTKNERGAW